VFEQVLGSSPPGGAGATLHHSRSMPERCSAMLSSSAPISITNRNGSRSDLASRQSGSGRLGLLTEQLGRPSPGSGSGRQPETPPRTSSVNGFPDGEGPAVPLAAANGGGGAAAAASGHYGHLAGAERVGSAGSRCEGVGAGRCWGGALVAGPDRALQ
jgi:hypothetical protein